MRGFDYFYAYMRLVGYDHWDAVWLALNLRR